MGNHLTLFRDAKTAKKMVQILSKYKGKPVTLMEVCGTHTMAIFKHGIRDVLPENIRLVSGPGCPVCVTPNFYIDSAIQLCQRDDVILTTFGDMMRVPGTKTTLLKEKALGRQVRIVYSPLDSLEIAREFPEKKVVFLSIGFETTIPVIALSVLKAEEEGITNYSILPANKTVPEVLKTLAGDKEIRIDGYLYPGHVSAIIGTKIYQQIAEAYKIPGVVTGFEPLDILSAIITLTSNIKRGQAVVENQYARFVSSTGNPVAIQKMEKVFEACDVAWRGIGMIPGSGLCVKEAYAAYDAWRIFDIQVEDTREPEGCRCGEVLKGKILPKECSLFGTACTPENPVGACMVSTEGTCAAYYKY